MPAAALKKPGHSKTTQEFQRLPSCNAVNLLVIPVDQTAGSRQLNLAKVIRNQKKKFKKKKKKKNNYHTPWSPIAAYERRERGAQFS
jgi:hypothetical protein